VRISELIAQGGVTMWPIILCSIIALTIFIAKIIEFFTLGMHLESNHDALEIQLMGSSVDEFETYCHSQKGAMFRFFEGVLPYSAEDADQFRAEARRIGSAQLTDMSGRMNLLSFVAQVAPLLGLLGTVIGMVQLFMDLNSGAGQSGGGVSVQVLASGIWKALMTTAGGLIVAVVAMGAHAFLTSRIDSYRRQVSDLIVRLTRLKRGGLWSV